MLLVTKANLPLADLLTSKRPMIIGAPPLHNSALLKAKRIFYNGKVDYEGLAWLLNRAMTRIKKQIGGGKATNSTRAQDSDDELSSLSLSPAPVTLRSKLQKATTESEDIIVEGRDPSLQKGALKSTHGHKRVEVVLMQPARKAGKRAPSVIVVRGSSGSEEMNIGGKCKVSDNFAEPFVSEDEQDPSTIHKRKAKSQQSSRPTKRMVSSLDTNTTQPSNLSCQVRVYSGRGSGQVWTKSDGGREQRAGQEVSPAGVGDCCASK